MKKLFFVIAACLFLLIQEANGQKIDALISKGNYEKAMSKIQTKIKKSGEDIEALYYLSVIHYKNKSTYFSLPDAFKTYNILNNLFKSLADLKTIEKLNSKGINSQTIEAISDSIYIKDLSLTSEQNSETSYNDFLGRYPELPLKYKDKVISLRDEIAFKTANESNSIDSYNVFMKKYPYSEKFYTAKKTRDHLAFQIAQEANTEASFEYFLNSYADSEDSKTAQLILENKIFERISKTNELSDFINFQKRFPRSEKSTSVTRIIEDIKFSALIKKNNIDEYYSYLSEDHPDELKKAANKELEYLKYKEVSKEQYIPNILAFLSEFPSSKYKAELKLLCDSLYFNEIKTNAKRDIKKSLDLYNDYDLNFPDSEFSIALKKFIYENFKYKIDSLQVVESQRFYTNDLGLKLMDLSEHPGYFTGQLKLIRTSLSFFDADLYSKLEKNIDRTKIVTYTYNFGPKQVTTENRNENIKKIEFNDNWKSESNPDNDDYYSKETLMFLPNEWACYGKTLFKFRNGLTYGVSYNYDDHYSNPDKPFENAQDYIFSNCLVIDNFNYGYIYDLEFDKLLGNDYQGFIKPLRNHFNISKYEIGKEDDLDIIQEILSKASPIMPIRWKYAQKDNTNRLLIVSSLNLNYEDCNDCNDTDDETTIFIFDLNTKKEILEIPGRLLGISPENKLLLNGNIDLAGTCGTNKFGHYLDNLPTTIYFDELDLNELIENISLIHSPIPDSSIKKDEFTTTEELRRKISDLQKTFIRLNSQEKNKINAPLQLPKQNLVSRNISDFELINHLNTNDREIISAFYRNLNSLPSSVDVPLEYKEYNLNNQTMSFAFNDTLIANRKCSSLLGESGEIKYANSSIPRGANWEANYYDDFRLENISPEIGRNLKGKNLKLVITFNKSYRFNRNYSENIEHDKSNFLLEDYLNEVFPNSDSNWIELLMTDYTASASLYSVYLQIDNERIFLK